MAIICPTVLAQTKEEFDKQINMAAGFARRIQIDLMDGDFASPRSIDLNQVWWPHGKTIDVHLMYKKPMEHLDRLISLKPNMVIIHAESAVDHEEFAASLHECGINTGICLLAETNVSEFGAKFEDFDHFLIFGGSLGSFGGQADLSLLTKIAEAKNYNSNLEIGWDGGANDQNVSRLANSGVDVINAGGFIQKSKNPRQAYQSLVEKITK